MPLTNIQYNAVVKWLRNRDENHNRLDWLFDSLNEGQMHGLVTRVKADLEAEYDASVALITKTKTDTTAGL